MMFDGLGSAAAVDSSTQAGQAQQKLDEDLNAFLNLLVTQLQNQDPLDPMDANEFTSQLVQFASVEQQIYANSNLEQLVSLSQISQTSMMVDYLGKRVEVIGDKFTLEEGEDAELSYSLDLNSRSTVISIQNEAGLTVFSTEGEIKPGRHEFTWNGNNQNGVPQPDGNYTIVVSPMDHDGNILETQTTVTGTVTGAAADDGEAFLYVGAILTPMDQILAVKEAKPETLVEEAAE